MKHPNEAQKIAAEFQAGKVLVVRKPQAPDNEHRMRKRIYEQARKRGYLWRFATLPGEVIVLAK